MNKILLLLKTRFIADDNSPAIKTSMNFIMVMYSNDCGVLLFG